MGLSWSSVGDFFGSAATGLGNLFTEVVTGPIGQQAAQWGVSALQERYGGTMAGAPSGTGYGGYGGTPPIWSGPGSGYPSGGPVIPNYNPVVPSGWTPLATIPASQPAGRMPGTELAPMPQGANMPSFPVTRFASYPQVQQAGYGAALGALGRAIPGMIAGYGIGEAFDSPQLPAVAGSGVMAAGGTPMFRPTMAGYRAQTFRAQNPATGADVYFRPAGKPILWSSDLSACRRVKKVAARARRKR